MDSAEGPLLAAIRDLEVKLAFMEREIETWKEAVNALHARLERAEGELRNALRELRGEDEPGQSFGGELSGETAGPEESEPGS